MVYQINLLQKGYPHYIFIFDSIVQPLPSCQLARQVLKSSFSHFILYSPVSILFQLRAISNIDDSIPRAIIVILHIHHHGHGHCHGQSHHHGHGHGHHHHHHQHPHHHQHYDSVHGHGHIHGHHHHHHHHHHNHGNLHYLCVLSLSCFPERYPLRLCLYSTDFCLPGIFNIIILIAALSTLFLL